MGPARVASHRDGLLSRPSGGPDRGASCPASCARGSGDRQPCPDRPGVGFIAGPAGRGPLSSLALSLMLPRGAPSLLTHLCACTRQNRPCLVLTGKIQRGLKNKCFPKF